MKWEIGCGGVAVNLELKHCPQVVAVIYQLEWLKAGWGGIRKTVEGSREKKERERGGGWRQECWR